MNPDHESRPWGKWDRLRGLVVAALLLVIASAVAHTAWTLLDVPDERPTSSSSRPDFRPPVSGVLWDEAPVVGVSLGGRHRAYLLQALLRPDGHVVNGRLGDLPVTVTYCDLCDCVQVFTGSAGGPPLDVAVAGADARRPRSLLLRVNGKLYWQDTGLPPDDEDGSPLPLAKADFVRTSWREWREAHPETEVFVGVAQPLQ